MTINLDGTSGLRALWSTIRTARRMRREAQVEHELRSRLEPHLLRDIGLDPAGNRGHE